MAHTGAELMRGMGESDLSKPTRCSGKQVRHLVAILSFRFLSVGGTLAKRHYDQRGNFLLLNYTSE